MGACRRLLHQTKPEHLKRSEEAGSSGIHSAPTRFDPLSRSRRATRIRDHGLADCQERVPREIAGPKGGLQGPSSSQPVTSRALASKSRSPLWSSHKTRSTPSLRALRSQNPPRFSPPQPPAPHSRPLSTRSRYLCPHVLSCVPSCPS